MKHFYNEWFTRENLNRACSLGIIIVVVMVTTFWIWMLPGQTAYGQAHSTAELATTVAVDGARLTAVEKQLDVVQKSITELQVTMGKVVGGGSAAFLVIGALASLNFFAKRKP